MRPLQPTDIWTAVVCGHITRSVLTVLRFRQGKWRNIAVKLTPATA
jgi:Na+-driven multidrug efflux pump